MADAPRLRAARGRPLAGRRELRRHAAGAEHDPGAGHRRLPRRSRRRGGDPRGLRQHGRAMGRQPRLQRHRGRAPRAQPSRRGGARGSSLRRAQLGRAGDAVRHRRAAAARGRATSRHPAARHGHEAGRAARRQAGPRPGGRQDGEGAGSVVEDLLGAAGSILQSTVRNATPLVFAALGGLFSERSVVVHIGLEGLILIAAFAGVLGAHLTGSALAGLLTALGAGLLFALIHALMCITFEADQIISGTAINLLALGGTGFLMVVIFGSGGTSPRVNGFGSVAIPLLSDIPVIGAALFDHSVLVYLMYILVPVVYFVVFRTTFGLRLRATGEVPEAVDTAGVNVQRMRYYGVALSGLLAACGGVYLSMGLLTAFTENMTGGRGFIALAALIFGRWNPIGAAGAALLFGFAQAITYRVSEQTIPIEFIQMFPYVLTIIALAGFGGRAIAPAAIGKPYRKE